MDCAEATDAKMLEGVFSPEGVRVPTSAERARALFSWQGGAYGEVLLAAPGSEPPPRPKSARDELALSCFSHVLLSLCEAFHLAFHCHGVLRVWPSDGPAGSGAAPLSAAQAWECFSALAPRFAYELAAYSQLRASGWIVRAGLKFGADFALYAPAATHTHAVGHVIRAHAACLPAGCACSMVLAHGWLTLQPAIAAGPLRDSARGGRRPADKLVRRLPSPCCFSLPRSPRVLSRAHPPTGSLSRPFFA